MPRSKLGKRGLRLWEEVDSEEDALGGGVVEVDGPASGEESVDANRSDEAILL